MILLWSSMFCFVLSFFTCIDSCILCSTLLTNRMISKISSNIRTGVSSFFFTFYWKWLQLPSKCTPSEPAYITSCSGAPRYKYLRQIITIVQSTRFIGTNVATRTRPLHPPALAWSEALELQPNHVAVVMLAFRWARARKIRATG